MATVPAEQHPPGIGPAIWKQEVELLEQRRAYFKTGTSGAPRPLPPHTVGFALSGGGIRSATFCLGVFQTLARLRLLHAVDYLSTVSGGGYFGSFWTAWLNRNKAPGHFAAVEEALGDTTSREVRWLRENGRYLAPNGSMDAFAGLAAHLRNLVAIHLSLGFYWVALFGALNAALLLLTPDSIDLQSPGDTLQIRVPPVALGLWYAVLALAAVLSCVGTVYFWTSATASGAKWRNRLSKWLTKLLVLELVLVALGLVDAAARLLYNTDGDLKPFLSLVGATTFATVGRRLYQWLQPLLSKPGGSFSLMSIATLGAAALGTLWLICFDWLALVLSGAVSTVTHESLPLPLASAAVALLAGLFALFCNWNRRLAFLNLSSHATLYAARLTRTFHGASNPARHASPERPSPPPVTDLLDTDVVPYGSFEPTASGGPVHLVNVTINETIDGRSQTEQRDRQGLPLAIGPAGLSVGVRHHAAWDPESARTILRADAPPGSFRVWGRPDAILRPDGRTLGEWVAISGAAFTTGLGAKTNRALSFLLGFANVRLGYWWNSGATAEPAPPKTLVARLRAIHTALLPVQTGLINEFLARFRGALQRTWYLSDGGHFENTAAYELIRRRVPFIVICDCGCDPTGEFEDLGNLVRKARIDFQTEITVCDTAQLAQRVAPDHGLSTFTTPAAFTDAMRSTPAWSEGHALLATIDYPDQTTGILLLLKPSLTGDEPADVLHYDRTQPEFPQEPTSDQFFDEAQWESYRKLGEHIGLSVFRHADTARPHWGLVR